jgi:lysozyme
MSKVDALLPVGTVDEVRAAFLCLAYNIGLGGNGKDGFSTSTALRRFKAGNLVGSAEALEWWNEDNGKVVKGLQRRRRAERLVMLGATPDSAIAAAEKAFP